jgi:glycosyltransferase involved in cell wall biosynthesis
MTEGAGHGAERLRVSLVVPVRDEAATIDELLTNIAKQTRQPDELIFVDGGSRDDTVARLRAFDPKGIPLRVIEAGEATPGRGRNLGIAAATYDWIVMADAGTRLEPDWLERLLEVHARDTSVDVVYGNFEPVTDSFFTRCAALVYVTPKRVRDGQLMRGPCVPSCLLRREVHRRVGGFPDLRASEDLIFMEKVRESGARIGWAPKATIWWELPPSLGKIFKKFVLYSKHNVWAGRQWDWHYGIARQYSVAAIFVILALLHSYWWLIFILLGAAGRIAKSIWMRREGRGLLWLINPVQFIGVGIILITIDLATLIGWAQCLWQKPERASPSTSET